MHYANSTITLHHFLECIANSHDDAQCNGEKTCKFNQCDCTYTEAHKLQKHNRELVMLVSLCFWVDILKPKTSSKSIALFALRYDVLYEKTLPPDVFDDVL